MSRAFVKEDAQDAPAVRARGASSLPVGTPNLATPRSARALRAELEALIAERDPLEGQVVANAIASERHRALTAEIRALERYLGTLEVVEPPAHPERVGFGTRVTLRRDADGQDVTRVVEIVGADEADPSAGSISFVSPLARALFGAVAGDDVSVPTPAGDEAWEVVAVGPLGVRRRSLA